MHLLVLSAFRRPNTGQWRLSLESQCTFWCSVLSDPMIALPDTHVMGLNAPFGAQCFPTFEVMARLTSEAGLNAPFGAQCFPTVKSRLRPWPGRVSMHLLVLSAFRQRSRR